MQSSESTKRALEVFTGIGRLPRAKLPRLLSDADWLDRIADQVRNQLVPELVQVPERERDPPLATMEPLEEPVPENERTAPVAAMVPAFDQDWPVVGETVREVEGARVTEPVAALWRLGTTSEAPGAEARRAPWLLRG